MTGISLGSVIAQQVCGDEAGPGSSQKVKSVGEGQDQGGARPGTGRGEGQDLQLESCSQGEERGALTEAPSSSSFTPALNNEIALSVGS